MKALLLIITSVLVLVGFGGVLISITPSRPDTSTFSWFIDATESEKARIVEGTVVEYKKGFITLANFHETDSLLLEIVLSDGTELPKEVIIKQSDREIIIPTPDASPRPLIYRKLVQADYKTEVVVSGGNYFMESCSAVLFSYISNTSYYTGKTVEKKASGSSFTETIILPKTTQPKKINVSYAISGLDQDKGDISVTISSPRLLKQVVHHPTHSDNRTHLFSYELPEVAAKAQELVFTFGVMPDSEQQFTCSLINLQIDPVGE